MSTRFSKLTLICLLSLAQSVLAKEVTESVRQLGEDAFFSEQPLSAKDRSLTNGVGSDFASFIALSVAGLQTKDQRELARWRKIRDAKGSYVYDEGAHSYEEAAAQTNKVRLNASLEIAKLRQSMVLEKLRSKLRTVTIVGRALLIVDAGYRVYIWNASDEKPSPVPAAAVLGLAGEGVSSAFESAKNSGHEFVYQTLPSAKKAFISGVLRTAFPIDCPIESAGTDTVEKSWSEELSNVELLDAYDQPRNKTAVYDLIKNGVFVQDSSAPDLEKALFEKSRSLINPSIDSLQSIKCDVHQGSTRLIARDYGQTGGSEKRRIPNCSSIRLGLIGGLSSDPCIEKVSIEARDGYSKWESRLQATCSVVTSVPKPNGEAKKLKCEAVRACADKYKSTIDKRGEQIADLSKAAGCTE